MKNVVKAVLFDLDGVIVFTDKYHYLGWKKLADEMGWDFNEEVNHGCRGVSRMASLQVILDHNHVDLPQEEKEALADKKNAYYVELLQQINEGDLYPGAVDFLRELRKRDVELALCSASRNAVMVLEKLGLQEFFATVVTGADITKTKPDPEVFLLAAERLNVPPQHCLVFEDAESGVEAAHRGRMKCIGVGPSERLPEALETITAYDEIDIDHMLETGHKKPIDPEPWTVAETEISPKKTAYWESLFALTNGYLGVRGDYDQEESDLSKYSSPGTFINSIYDYLPYHHLFVWKGLPTRWHAMANLARWTTINLYVDGERFSISNGDLTDYRRELDMRNGVMRSSLVWHSPSGKQVRVESVRLVSMTRRHSAAIRYRVTPLNFSGSVTLESVIRGRHPGNVFPNCATEIVEKGTMQGRHFFLTRTGESDFTVGMAFAHELSGSDVEMTAETCIPGEDSFRLQFEVPASQNESITLDKHACFYTSFEEPAEDVKGLALAGVNADLGDGFDRLLEEQSAFWERFWDTADIRIEGNVADQQALRFTLFHLRQSHPEDDRRSISATGMTSDGYWGHVFWDTEMYITPMFQYTQPDLVKPLLMYRHSILDKAREHAVEMDGTGALWSWNSINGEECGVVYEAATAQYHINPDVIDALRHYYLQTGDSEFMYRQGAEMLFESARFLADRGKFVPGKGFCINVVCGPDEYGCAVDNNCYTNMMTQLHLDFAVQIYEEMKEKSPDLLATLVDRIGLSDAEVAVWNEAADKMYVPFSTELGIHMQDDSFIYRDPVDMSKIPLYVDIRWDYHPLNLWRMQVAKQADVLLLMLTRGDMFSQEIKRANCEYYEPRTNHGSSLSPAIHSIAAAEIGKVEEAYDYFRLTAYMDLSDFKNNASNGVHSACLGGTWMALVNGMAGMRDYADRLMFSPVLPKAWEGYSLKIRYRGRLISVNVRREGVTYELLSGDAVSLRSGDVEVNLTPESPSLTTPLSANF